MKRISIFVKEVIHLPAVSEIRDVLVTFFLFDAYRNDTMLAVDTTTFLGWLNIVTTVSMSIIAMYGAIKIIARILYGDKADFQVGLLEVFHSRLRVNTAIRAATETKEEADEKVEKIISSIQKVKTGRCRNMSVFTKLKANMKTNAAMTTLGALAITGAGYFAQSYVPVIAELPINWSDALAAEVLAGAALIVPGVRGKGKETVEEYKARIQAVLEAKQAKKQAKLEAKAAKKTPEARAKKIAAKTGISEVEALKIAKNQVASEQQKIAEKAAKKEGKLLAKVAKKYGVDKAHAKAILDAQKNAGKKV